MMWLGSMIDPPQLRVNVSLPTLYSPKTATCHGTFPIDVSVPQPPPPERPAPFPAGRAERTREEPGDDGTPVARDDARVKS